jgi:hypothetical protein
MSGEGGNFTGLKGIPRRLRESEKGVARELVGEDIVRKGLTGEGSQIWGRTQERGRGCYAG